ncbi:hypothetical protein GCG54_00003182 [Colletotrichum gloeosporioides]|uniref:AA1-like domain-containing protein n=1 Tax=Colletotrichum gloeosporioides TaxID=474922 RepID=A0A8H4CWC4_COLGL|nr:uncharacterized protein GCG54_00003182 [Colletotrichum gloeosporioides]KAF3811002.1 hypothetical protein GCG54_00003182 [Colletotrichum gloeosporioides]
MQFSSLAASFLMLSFPLAAIAQQRCSVPSLSSDTNKENSVAVNFDAATNKYSASVPPGNMELIIPSLSITNNGGKNRTFCLAIDPSSPRTVDCFGVEPKSTCTIPDYRGVPFRLDTYLR